MVSVKYRYGIKSYSLIHIAKHQGYLCFSPSFPRLNHTGVLMLDFSHLSLRGILHPNLSSICVSCRSYKHLYLNHGPQRIGRKYKKVRFMAYTDETFKTRKVVQYESGILGPLLYGEVGDTLLVSGGGDIGSGQRTKSGEG